MPIRKMEIADIPAVLAIQEELRFQEWNQRQFESEIHATYAACFVYESDDDNCTASGEACKKILGYSIFHILGPDSELLSIATTGSQQQKGIGQKLLDAGFDLLDFSNGDCCFLEVREGNAKARKFYEKNKFKSYSVRKKYYSDGEDAVLYKTEP